MKLKIRRISNGYIIQDTAPARRGGAPAYDEFGKPIDGAEIYASDGPDLAEKLKTLVEAQPARRRAVTRRR